MILAYNLDGELLGRYKNQTEASKNTGVDRAIQGYTFKYKNEDNRG